MFLCYKTETAQIAPTWAWIIDFSFEVQMSWMKTYLDCNTKKLFLLADWWCINCLVRKALYCYGFVVLWSNYPTGEGKCYPPYEPVNSGHFLKFFTFSFFLAIQVTGLPIKQFFCGWLTLLLIKLDLWSWARKTNCYKQLPSRLKSSVFIVNANSFGNF